MENKAADESLLAHLHKLAVDQMVSMMKPQEVPMMAKGEVLLDSLGNPRMMTLRPTAAELAAVTAMLKANNITCAPGEDSAVGELQKLMEARRAKSRPVLPAPLDEIHTGGMH